MFKRKNVTLFLRWPRRRLSVSPVLAVHMLEVTHQGAAPDATSARFVPFVPFSI